VRASNGAITTFDVPGAGTGPFQGTETSGINSAGTVTGEYLVASNVWHSFVRAPNGTITTFDVPGAGTGPFQGTLAQGIRCRLLRPKPALFSLQTDRWRHTRAISGLRKKHLKGIRSRNGKNRTLSPREWSQRSSRLFLPAGRDAKRQCANAPAATFYFFGLLFPYGWYGYYAVFCAALPAFVAAAVGSDNLAFPTEKLVTADFIDAEDRR
jgi:hypothetical protein